MKKIFLASDHAGFELKEKIKAYLESKSLQFEDLGPHSEARVDYPDYARLVAQKIEQNPQAVGVLVCGTGVGMALTANAFKTIRAASLTDVYSTKMAREHNDLNVLCLGARVVGFGLAELILDTFLNTNFLGGRHQERLDKIIAIKKEIK